MTPRDEAAGESQDAQVERLAKLDESEGGAAAEAAAEELAEEFEEFDYDREYEFLEKLEKRGPKAEKQGPVWALFEFDTPIFCPMGSRVIASRLDFDVHTTECRVAFHGTLISSLPKKGPKEVDRSEIKVYKLKQKFGTVDHIADDKTIVARELFKKETDLTIYRGL